MTDPYKILGVAPSATDDEVKQAYRNLCRKYHPDRNPGNEAAEDMFKIVQSSYEAIMDERKSGGFRRAGANGSYSGGEQYRSSQSAGYGHPEDAYYQAATNEISNSNYRRALQVLEQIQNRNAHWYYLSALANAGIGNNYVAMGHAQTAASLAPENRYYQALAQQLSGGGATYRSMRAPYGSNMSNDDFCMRLCALGCFYNACCDGDPCVCC